MRATVRESPGIGVRPLALAVAACFSLAVHANPTGPTVVSGSAAFRQAGNLLQINNSPSAIINWQSFSIGAGEITKFVQQSNLSAVLNRVTTQNPSTILAGTEVASQSPQAAVAFKLSCVSALVQTDYYQNAPHCWRAYC